MPRRCSRLTRSRTRSGRSPRGGRPLRTRQRDDRPRPFAASRGARVDPFLPVDVVERSRPAVPLPSELLGLRRRGDPASWAVGGFLDGRGADLPLPSLGRRGLRSAARDDFERGLVVAAVALRTLAIPLRLIVRRNAACLDPALPLRHPTFRQCLERLSMAEPRRAAARPALRIEGGRFLIVEARFYDAIGEHLLVGASRAFEAAGAACDVVSVDGALEIPAGMAIALDAAEAAGRAYDGAIALGCVVRGETYHFEIVAGESARALMYMSVERKLALGNGILTTDTLAQAEERADPERGDKGGDAARAAINLVLLKRRLAPT